MGTLYEQIAERIGERIRQGRYCIGDRLPGVRALSHELGVSVSTVVQAQKVLEARGWVQRRARSGHYVRSHGGAVPPPPAMSRPAGVPTRIHAQPRSLRRAQAVHHAGACDLSTAALHWSWMPRGALQRAWSRARRRDPVPGAGCGQPPGLAELREHLARRMADAGCGVRANDLVITSGCQEALALGLRAATGSGDVVAIASPTSPGLLRAMDALGLRALEIPAHPEDGISLYALKFALERYPVAACALATNFSDPLGYSMPEHKKEALVALLAEYRVPLLEDDVYGELGYAHRRPLAAKHFDAAGRVLYCGSFSPSLSPGLGVGWIAPGRYRDRVEYLQYATSQAVPAVSQYAVSELLEQGAYDAHLRRVRERCARQVARMAEAVGELFPAGTRVTQPEGGLVLWVELPQDVDAVALYERALAQGIAVAPGPAFSATGGCGNFIRLSYARPWSAELQRALRAVARLACPAALHSCAGTASMEGRDGVSNPREA